jgi:hypothetical protein
MSRWTDTQIVWMDTQEEILDSELPHFQFQDRDQYGLTIIRGRHISAAGFPYDLAVWLKGGAPHEMPGLYVLSPSPLMCHGNTIAMTSHGSSHRMHVWETDWAPNTKICFCKTEYWNPAETIVGILFKAFLWIEAYEVHCRTGNAIDDYSLSYA